MKKRVMQLSVCQVLVVICLIKRMSNTVSVSGGDGIG